MVFEDGPRYARVRDGLLIFTNIHDLPRLEMTDGRTAPSDRGSKATFGTGVGSAAHGKIGFHFFGSCLNRSKWNRCNRQIFAAAISRTSC
jgi:hypothetical protein